MKITEITYGKKFNLGNYESEEYRLTAVLDEDENTIGAIAALKLEVIEAQSGVTFKVEASEPEPVMKPKPKKAKKVIDEPIPDETGESDPEIQDPAPKAKKKFKKKATTYDRANEIHKKLFSASLAEIAPSWKSTDAGKAKAKQLSRDSDGVDFLDDDGDVLESFVVAMKKGMK